MRGAKKKGVTDMTIGRSLRLVALISFFLLPALPAGAAEDPGILWKEDRVVALGQGVAPTGASDASGRLLARRAAVADLQRNVLEFIEGARIEARTTMKDFMASDVIRSSVQGLVRHVEIRSATWDGEVYTVEGFLSLSGLREIVAPQISGLRERPLPVYTEGYSNLVVDASHLPFRPSLVIALRSESGRKVYGPEFIDRQAFLDRGLCRYAQVPEASSRRPLLASPAEADGGKALVIKALSLSEEGEIVIDDAAADVIDRNAFDFRIPGDVTILTKTAALRGALLWPLLVRLRDDEPLF